MEDFVIRCEFCQQTPLEVVETKCCSTICCWNCILEKRICKCGGVLNVDNVAVVPELQEVLDATTLDYCRNSGCNFTSSRKSIEEHKKTCEYREIVCPYNSLCGKFIFKDFSIHQEECPHAEVDCECGIKFIRYNLIHHKCPERLVQCECGESVKFRFLGLHKEDRCPDTKITCPYAKYGCPLFDTRAEIQIHLNEAQESHLHLLANYDQAKDNQIKLLSAQVNSPLSSQFCSVTKKIAHAAVTTIPQSRLVKRGLNLVDNCTKETLFKIIFFFFLATLLPMKYFLVRFLFTTLVMRKVWVVLFGPAIRSARYSRSCTAAIEQMIYLTLFIILSVLFAFYSKFL